MRVLIVLALIGLSAVLAAEDGPITTWRGPTYQGVLQGRGIPMDFYWYDEGGTDLAKKYPQPGRATSQNRFERELYANLPGNRWPEPGSRLNACWRVPLPAWGASNVVISGDKAFTTCEAVPGTGCQYTLVCVDIPTGKLDWVKPIDHLLAMPKAEAARLAKIRKAEIEGWAETMRLWNRIYWDNERDTWHGREGHNMWNDVEMRRVKNPKLSPERQALLDQAKADGYKDMTSAGYWQLTGHYGHPRRAAEKKAAYQSRAYIHPHNKDWPWYGSTCASPVGDGTAVYAVAAPDAVVCYELDGKLRWAADMNAGLGAREGGFFNGVHRSMASPVLADGKLIYFNTQNFTSYAYDCRTGKVAWQSQLPGEVGGGRDYGGRQIPRGYSGHMGPGGTPLIAALKDVKTGAQVEVLVLVTGHVQRVSDGKVLGWFNRSDNPDKTDSGGYASDAMHGDIHCSIWGAANRLWLQDGELKSERLYTKQARRSRSKERPQVHYYYLSMISIPQGFLGSNGAWDPLTGTSLGLRPRGGGLELPEQNQRYVNGCVSADGVYLWRSREVANDTILFGTNRLGVEGDKGMGFIVEGRQPDAVRQAAIDRFGVSRIHMGWCHPTAFGNRIFLRTNAYMYCFGTGSWRPPK